MRAVPAAIIVLAVLAAGCGSSAHPRGRRAGAPSGPPAAAGPRASGGGPGSAVAVIKDWANALRSGDVTTAAGYFAIPSIYANGTDARGNLVVVRIRSRAAAVLVNRGLPCGAIFVSAAPHGRAGGYLAIFRLTGRPGPGGTSCSPGAGSEATTFFQIAHGRIAEWIRGPDVIGSGTGTGGTPPPTTTPSGGVPVA